MNKFLTFVPGPFLSFQQCNFLTLRCLYTLPRQPVDEGRSRVVLVKALWLKEGGTAVQLQSDHGCYQMSQSYTHTGISSICETLTVWWTERETINTPHKVSRHVWENQICIPRIKIIISHSRMDGWMNEQNTNLTDFIYLYIYIVIDWEKQ